MSKVDKYNIMGPTILHQHPLLSCLNDGLRLTLDESLYERVLCGGTKERSSSTLEIPDVDINSKFRINSECIRIHPIKNRGGDETFLFKIEVLPNHKETVNEISLLMQYHPRESPINKDQIEKSIAKSYVEKKGKIFLSSHLARWQLLGVIKNMRDHGLDVDQSSRMASEVGLKNGVYNVMLYDTMVCRRGILRRNAFRSILEEKVKTFDENKEELMRVIDFLLCFFPQTGVQVDYTAGFHISRDAVPGTATHWVEREGAWPSKRLKEDVLSQGAVLVPKTFKDGDENEKSIGWRINFDLEMILNDPDYSSNVDTRRILIILKDLKNIKMRSSLVKSYHLKVCLAWAMELQQEKRNNFSNDDLLLATLNYLQNALYSLKLPDFFNEKFNHFHRNKDRRSEAKEVAERIKYCIQHWDSTLADLTRAQEEFRRNVRSGIYNSYMEKPHLSGRLDYDKVVRLTSKQLPELNPSDIERVWKWMVEISKTLTPADKGPGEERKKVRTPSTPENRWQRKLKKSYDILSKNSARFNYDCNFIFPVPEPGDILSISILENFNKNKEAPEIMATKLKIWTELDKIFKEQTDFDCEVAGFGSSFNGFGLSGCDLDLQIQIFEGLKVGAREFLFKLRKILIDEKFVEEKGARVVEAKVPVLKATHKQSSICLDLSVSTSSKITPNVRAAHLFYHCAQGDTRVRPLVLAVKKWARSHNINNPHKRSLSSHAIAIMVLHYLQAETKLNVIPSFYKGGYSRHLNYEEPNKKMMQQFQCQTSLGNLFLGFMNYMAGLDTEKFCLTVEEKLDRMDEKMHYTRELRPSFQPLIVQDPIDKRNAAYSILNKKALKLIKDKFNITAQIASRETSLERLCHLGQALDLDKDELNYLNFDDINIVD